jgi:hypothetical protein
MRRRVAFAARSFKTQKLRESIMKRTTRLILTSAAMTGLYAGSLATRAFADDQAGSSDQSKSQSPGTHACKGQNSCKGQGGCKAGDNGCKGQNSCKGKGGCNTNSGS